MEFVDLPLILDKGSGLFEDYSYTQRRPDIPQAQFQRARENSSFALTDREAEEREVHQLSHHVWRHAVELHIIYTYVPEHNDHFMLSSVWHLGNIAYSAVINVTFFPPSHSLSHSTFFLHFIVLMLIMAVVMTAFLCTYMHAGSHCYSGNLQSLLSTEWGREMEMDRLRRALCSW